ncbi:meiosis-specific protein [Salix suchowensis]|nr:meiosis-specific protein [Salix suchowensis]
MEVDTRQKLQDVSDEFVTLRTILLMESVSTCEIRYLTTSKCTFQDQMSDCRSFGSKCHPSSQSRKISIGILIDSLWKKGTGGTERENSKKESSVEGTNKGKGAFDITKGNQTEAPDQVHSPWITTRSFHQKLPTSDGVLYAVETSNLPGSTGRLNKISRVKNVPATHSVEFFSNQTSNSFSGDLKQKFSGFTYKRKGGKYRNSQSEDEPTFATAKEGTMLDIAMTDDKTEERRTETLKMKLWEILENVSSPKSQPSNSQAHQIGVNNLNQKKILDQTDDVVVKPRQSSDTIETVSETPDLTMKRPVTRSLTQQRASTKQKPEKTKVDPSSSHRQKFQEKDVYSFKEGLLQKQNVAFNDGSSMSIRKKGQIKCCSIEPRKINFSEDDNADEIQERSHKSEISLPAGKMSSHSNKMGNIHGSQNKRDYCEPKNRNKERDPHQPARETPFPAEKVSSLSNKLGDFHGSCRNRREYTEPKNRNQERDSHQSVSEESHQSLWTLRTGGQQEKLDTPSSNSAADPQNDFQSPTFKINSPTSSFPPSSKPKSDQIKQVFCSPEDDVAAELMDFPPSKTSPLKGEKDVEGCLFEPSPEEGYSESSEEGSPIVKGCREGDNFSPETATTERSKFMLHPTKRLRNHNVEKLRKFTPTSPSLTGTSYNIVTLSAPCIVETELIPEISEQNQGNELERVIMLFAIALENLKKKMKLETKKKSSDILMSVSEEIHLQLNNIESQIQKDLVKLSSVSKSKRKRLESRFEEKQEELKLIHDKFKQDIYQHLQECKITLEGLEMHQNDFKGTVKKQKSSHQKLLMQAEETVKTQLNDAQRRITAVHKMAREKTLQLKHVVAECLNEGVLS